jgi:hypothetical protein
MTRFSEHHYYPVTMAKKSCFSYVNSSSAVLFRLYGEGGRRSRFYALFRTKPEPTQGGYTRSEFEEILEQGSVKGICFPAGEDSSPVLEFLSRPNPSSSQGKRKGRKQS